MRALIKSPSKEQVRQYMTQRVAQHSPPPSQEEIRRQLGWELIDASRTIKARQR